MKKTPNSKLSLRTETVATLTPSHLHQVAGGWTTIIIQPTQYTVQTQNLTTMTLTTQSTTGSGSGG